MSRFRGLVPAMVMAAGLVSHAAANDGTTCTSGKGDEAIAACSRLIEAGALSAKSLPGAYVMRGFAWRAKGEIDRAIADFDEAIRLDPSQREAHIQRAIAWNRKGDRDRAKLDYDAVLRLDPKHATTYNNRGNYWRDRQDFAQAMADYDAAIRLDPSYAMARRNRALAWAMSGERERAIAEYTEALRIDPKFALAVYDRARTRADLGDLDGALADFAEAIRLDPTFVDAFNERGGVWLKRNDLNRAIADYSEAIRLDPKYALFYRNRGLAWEREGEIERAIVDYSDAILRDPKSVRAYNQRALLFERTGNLDRALADFKSAHAVAPGLPQAAERISRIEEKIAAREQARRAVPEKGAVAKPVPETRIALVIGNSNYIHKSKLPNPRNDAEKIAATLKRVGFTSVTLLHDLPRRRLDDALKSFAAQAARADWAVVYFAGHGIEVAGVNYLLPIDSKLASDRTVAAETVELQRVLLAVEGARKLRLVILDACRDNPFVKGMARTDKTRSVGGKGLAPVEPEGATLVAYAARHGQQAEDGDDGANSPFVTALTRHIEEPGLELNFLFRKVREDVLRLTERRQEPFTYGALPVEELHFKRR